MHLMGNNPQHTPGPWIIAQTSDGMLAVKSVNPDDKFAICTFAGFRKRQVEDARLIAAAPDLLAALDRLIAMYDSMFLMLPDDEMSAFNKVLTAAHRAVLNAQGRYEVLA